MPSNNSKYSPEMRQQTARFILENDRSATSVAEEMGIDTNTVCRWVRDFRRSNSFPTYAQERGIAPARPRGDKEATAKVKAKRECFYGKEYTDLDEVKTDLFSYIELFYNRKRMHSTLDYKTPVEFKRLYLQGMAA